MRDKNHWPFLFGIMAIIAFSAIFIAYQEEEKNALWRSRLYYGVSMERQAPMDIVQGGELVFNEEQFRMTYNITYPCWDGNIDVTIEYGNGSSTSMIPTLSYGHQALCLSINSTKCLQMGDIVVNKDSGNTHRIIAKGIDENGTYFLTMGDNNFDYSEHDVVLREDSNLCVVFGIIY